VSDFRGNFGHGPMHSGSADQRAMLAGTIDHYERLALQFWEGTRDHDVSQNYQHFLAALPDRPGLTLLDLGCGPGRDLRYFSDLGHTAIGLDGCESFVRMATEFATCQVWHQDFLALDLPAAHFDGIFANAALFHVPPAELHRVLRELQATLKPGGVLFFSNPRGNGESWDGSRYANYMEFPAYSDLLIAAGFEIVEHYYRPAGKPRAQQPWLAVVARSSAETAGAPPA